MVTRPDTIIGWDLGGAHVKAAWLDCASGRFRHAYQLASPLWQDLSCLRDAISEVLGACPRERVQHAVTMTGELADVFPDRQQGVQSLVQEMRGHVEPSRLAIYAGRAGFVTPDVAMQHCAGIASANWLASSTVAAHRCREGLFIDVGSTTTDITLLADGKVRARGFDDHARMRHDELIYTGVARTPVMAVVDRVPVEGDWIGVAAECFATMADVYRLTGELPSNADLLPSADGGDKTPEGSARRLARMAGRDLSNDVLAWQHAADYVAAMQLHQIMRACHRLLSRGLISDSGPLIGAGVGRFLVRKLAQQWGRAYMDFACLFDAADVRDTDVADCAPAAAVAFLLYEDLVR